MNSSTTVLNSGISRKRREFENDKKWTISKLLVDEIHSTTVATIGSDGHPQTRIIDMMYYDEEGVYFLTAKGKAFYDQLMEQQYVAISATKEKIAVSLRGRIKNIGKKNLDIMFERNPYMKKIYPGDTKDAIEVFQL